MTTHMTTDAPAKPRRLRRFLLIAAIPALAIGWWLGSPLFIDSQVDEAFPVATVVPAETTPTTVASDTATTIAASDTTVPVADSTPTTEAPTGPVALASGSFEGFDAVHQGSGSATFYDVDGSRVLRFEDFDVTNGPDLRVNLVLTDGSHVDLGALKGNVGNQNYDIPADVDLDLVESVLIYCRAFSVEFAQAVLS